MDRGTHLQVDARLTCDTRVLPLLRECAARSASPSDIDDIVKLISLRVSRHDKHALKIQKRSLCTRQMVGARNKRPSK